MLAKRDPPEGGGSVAVGFGRSRNSFQTKVFHAAATPGNQETSSEATWFGEVDGARFGGRGSVPGFARGLSQPSDRKATAGHQCPWPSSEVRPSPCAGVAARFEDEASSETSGDWKLREPSGSHRVLRGLAEFHRLPREPLGCHAVLRGLVGYYEGTREIFGFPRSHRPLPSRTFGCVAGTKDRSA